MIAPAPPMPAVPSESYGASPARRQAEALVDAWVAGEPPDTRDALSRFPHLRLEKSVVLDLAYEEFCLRRDRGEPVETDAFCERFPEYRNSLRRVIDAHQFLEQNDTVLDQAPVFNWPAGGELFEEYRIVRQLGRGAFARVYLAWDDATRSHVVVKISIGDVTEAQLAGPLDHPAIMPVKHARAIPSGASYVVMPFLGCATLHDVLDTAFPGGSSTPARARDILQAQAKTARPDEVVPADDIDPRLAHGSYFDGVTYLLTELAHGLAFLHSRGIRHCDLKPSNVLLSWNGRPVILDFNLAEPVAAELPRCGGTLPYMAPEQIQSGLLGGKAGACDARADVFSFGAIAYELLTGRHPFGTPPTPPSRQPLRAREAAVWLLGRQRSGAQPLRRREPELDRALAALIQRCLEFDAKNRPTAAALAKALDRLGRWPHRLQQRVRRRPKLAIAATVLLLLVGLGAGVLVASRPPYEQRLYARAVAAYQQGDAKRAEGLAGELLKRDGENAKYYFLRGLALLRQEAIDDALRDFNRAHDRAADGKSAAYLAYCHSYRDWHEPAILYADLAEKQHGVRTAALFNNRAYSYLHGAIAGKSVPERLASARTDLDEALRHDPNLVDAYFNRACLEFQLWRKTKDARCLDRAAADIQRVVSAEHASSQPYTKAAEIAASQPHQDEIQAQRVIAYLKMAIARGRKPATLTEEPAYRRYHDRADFQQLLRSRAADSWTTKPAGVVEPDFDPIP